MKAAYISPNCGTQVNCFQTYWNTQQFSDCNWSNGGSDVNCTGSHFVPTDVGKRITGFNVCQTDPSALPANTLGSQSGTVIARYVSSTHVTVNNAATGSQASNGCIYYGNPDDTGISKAEIAANNSTTCPVIILPAGIGMVVQPHFYNNPAACTRAPEETGASYVEFGFQVSGLGPDVSVIYVTPDFNFSACTHGPSRSACFGGVNSSNSAAAGQTFLFRDWKLTGGGLWGAKISGTHNIIELSGDSGLGALEHFMCSNIAIAGPDIRGVDIQGGFHSTIEDSSIDGCGSTTMRVETNGFVDVWHSSIEDGAIMQIDNYGSAGIHNKSFVQPGSYTSAGADVIRGEANSGTTLDSGSGIVPNGQANQMVGWIGLTNATAVFDNAVMLINNSNNPSNSQCVALQSGAKVSLHNFVCQGGGGNSIFLYLQNADSQVTDLGGNYQVNTGGSINNGIILNSYSITGTRQVATNITPSTGWGATGTAGNGVSAVAGQTMNEAFTITAAGSPSTNPTIALTFPTAFWAIPTYCVATQVGGTGAVAQTMTTMVSTTAVTFTWNGTPVSGKTYVFNVNCSSN
jgi:hypothetical protein